MHVALIPRSDPRSPNVDSGMNYQTLRALERLGHRVSMVVAPGGGAGGDGGGSLRGLARRHLTPGGRERLRTLSWRLRGQIRPGATSEAFLAHARQRAAHAEETLAAIEREHGRVDCLAVTVSSVPAYGLRQAWPIVYFSDITARIANTSYEAFAGRGGAYHRASEQVERESLARMFRAAFASEASLRSAIADHGLDPARGVLAPMGPNVGVPDDAPEAMLREIEAPTPPTRACVRMLVVAADPVRKRLDLCVEAVERLRARGIGAELTSIGGTTPRFRAAMARWPGVFHSLGMLRLGDERDAARQREAMLTSHLMLLASTGEAYGIAPVEMAHFGRPSIVSDAGGLTTVVRNGETGIVLPVGALGRTWADEIERLVDDPERYRTLARGALERARRELNWDAWTATIGRMIEEAVRTPIPHA